MDNVFSLYPMLERRRRKYNFRLHAFSIAQNREIHNRRNANAPYKNILLFLIAFLFISPALHSQTLDEIQTLLKNPIICYAQAARFVLEAADVQGFYDKTSEQGAMSFAIEKKWLPAKAKAHDAISLENFSHLVMKAFGLKGGPMYTLFNSAHYSYREMVYQNLIQEQSDPQMKVSGEKMFFIVSRVLVFIEGNSMELPLQTDEIIDNLSGDEQ